MYFHTPAAVTPATEAAATEPNEEAASLERRIAIADEREHVRRTAAEADLQRYERFSQWELGLCQQWGRRAWTYGRAMSKSAKAALCIGAVALLSVFVGFFHAFTIIYPIGFLFFFGPAPPQEAAADVPTPALPMPTQSTDAFICSLFSRLLTSLGLLVVAIIVLSVLSFVASVDSSIHVALLLALLTAACCCLHCLWVVWRLYFRCFYSQHIDEPSTYTHSRIPYQYTRASASALSTDTAGSSATPVSAPAPEPEPAPVPLVPTQVPLEPFAEAITFSRGA